LPSRWGVTIHDCKSSPCLLPEVLDSDSIADTIPSSTGLRASTEMSVIGLYVFFLEARHVEGRDHVWRYGCFGHGGCIAHLWMNAMRDYVKGLVKHPLRDVRVI